MTFDYPTPRQLPILRQLWKTVFGDSDAFLDDFFSTAFSPLRCRCAMENGETVGMLYWFDLLHRDRKMAYLYAVATHPDHRGKGICRKLMADTHALLAGQGYAGALLVPQEAGLRQMYAGFGYQEATTVSETFCAAGDSPVSLHRIQAEEYAKLRREYLPQDALLQEGESLRFLTTQACFFRGSDFLLAARTVEEDSLFGYELLGSAAAAPGILKALGCAQGTFRTPGTKIPFAMFLPLEADAKPPSYFGFAFD